MATHECTFPGDARSFSKVAAGAGLRQPRDLRADHAAAAGCRRLLDNMVTHEDGVRRGLRMECLHRFRVSVRRTRSLLSQLDEVFSPDAAARYRREFKWLASVTGAARDLDVHLLKMDEYHARLPADTADHLAPLDELLRHHRGVEGRRLSKALGSKRYGKLVEDWRRFLHGDIAGDSPPAHARRSVVDVARATIWRAYRLVRRHGRNIDADSSAEALHELRLDCKKLRYLLEFFCDLFDQDDIAPLLKSLKRLQSNLGALNDLEVQQRTLQQFASEMDPREPARNCAPAGASSKSTNHRTAALRQLSRAVFGKRQSGPIRATVQAFGSGKVCRPPGISCHRQWRMRVMSEGRHD